MTEDAILLSTLREASGALCSSCLEELCGVRERRADVLLERLSQAGAVIRLHGQCRSCQRLRTVSKASPVTPKANAPAKPGSNVVDASRRSARTKSTKTGSRIDLDVGNHALKITRTRQEWQLGFHCAGFPTRDEVYRYFRPLTAEGWRISNVFESTERGYDWYVHVRKPGEEAALQPADLADTLRKTFGTAHDIAVKKDGDRHLEASTSSSVPHTSRAERAAGMRKPLAQRLQDAIAQEAKGQPVVAQIPARREALRGANSNEVSPMEWADLRQVWSDLLFRRVSHASLTSLLEEQSRVTAILADLQGEADWAIGRALLRHDSPDALDLLVSPHVQERLKEHPDELWHAIRLASRERRPESVVILRKTSPIQAPGDIYVLTARAYFELGQMKDSLKQFHLAEHDTAYRMTGDDLGRKAQTLFKVQRYEECLEVTRRAIESGTIPLETVYDLASGTDLPATDRIGLVSHAWEHVHNIDQARELESSLLTATQLLVKQLPQDPKAIMRNLSAWVELLLAGHEPERVWEVLEWVKNQKLSLSYIVGVLDSIASTYPDRAKTELEVVLTVHVNQMMGTRAVAPDSGTLAWARDLLVSLHGDETLAELLLPPEPVAKPITPASPRYPNVKVLLVGASQSVRNQVRSTLKKQYGITGVSEVPPHWEGTIDTNRVRDLVASHDVVVVSAAMMDHALWHQLGKDRAKLVYPPSGGASGTVRTVAERIAGTI